MFLKSITLHGFKSFADPTQLDLKPGVTTVVGPNGCGKSNIMDAIRWVLGEQSAKALRGGKMQDVIFAGTENRKSLPFCEVKLVFTDCERELGTQFHEVEIVRRVTRDEGSDYFINGKVCRLKDIQNLFMDTGIGQVSYSFLVQGQVDQILSSNPMERRAIFEEAAGITKYKSQRKEALNKLSLTEVNLTRITDIIDEVSKRMGTLKRQAGKALRWKRQRHRMEHLDRAWNSRQYLDLTTESGSYRSRVAEAEAEMAKLKASVVAQYKLSTQIKAERAEMYSALEEKRAQLYALRARRQQILSQCELRRSRVEHMEARIQQIEGELRLLREQEAGIREGWDDPSGQLEVRRQAVAAAQARCSEQEAKVAEIDRDGQTKARQLQEFKQQLVASENQMTQTRASSTRLEVGIESYHAKHESLLQSFHQYEAEWKGISQRANELEVMLVAKTQEREQTAAALAALRARLAALEGELSQARASFGDLEKQYTQLAAEYGILDGLQKRLEGFGEGAKAMLGGKLAPVVDPVDLSVLAQGLQVDASHQKFCEVVLGPLAEAVVYRRVDRVAEVADALEERDFGRACLVVPDLGFSRADTTKVPDVLTAAKSLIRSGDSQVSAWLDLLLQDVYFCETIRDAIDFVSRSPGFAFEMIVTRRGEVLTRKGVLHAGSSGKTGSGILKRQQEIRRIAGEKSRVESLLKSRAADLETALARMDTAKSELEEQRDIHALVEQELSNLKTEIAANERACKAADERRQNYARMLSGLDDEKDQALKSLSASRADLERAEARINGLREQIVASESELAEMRMRREEFFHLFSDQRVRLSEEKQSLYALEQTIAENARRIQEMEKRRVAYETEQRESRESILILSRENTRDLEESDRLNGQEAALQESLDAADGAFREVEARIAAVEDEGRRLIDSERDATSRLQEMQLALSQKDIYAKSIQEKMADEYQVDIGTCDWRKEIWNAGQRILANVDIGEMDEETDLDELALRDAKVREPDDQDLKGVPDPDWKEIQEEIQALRSRLAAMGPVNLVAIDEYGDLRQRYEFLKQQSDDLWQSKNTLVRAIDEINKTSEALFKDTFTKICTNFKETYHRLTGGGEADLQLVEGEDVLDCGIDIIARPPGTRLRSLSLLSGGQKTMTAVALLFAIYMVKPSPFCVLDELDAPLDDANIGRFIDMLKDFTRFSQFLIISHNKRTMAAADSLFGVTMEEKGVSRILSMRFSSDEDLVASMVEPVGTVES